MSSLVSICNIIVIFMDYMLTLNIWFCVFISSCHPKKISNIQNIKKQCIALNIKIFDLLFFVKLKNSFNQNSYLMLSSWTDFCLKGSQKKYLWLCVDIMFVCLIKDMYCITKFPPLSFRNYYVLLWSVMSLLCLLFIRSSHL